MGGYHMCSIVFSRLRLSFALLMTITAIGALQPERVWAQSDEISGNAIQTFYGYFLMHLQNQSEASSWLRYIQNRRDNLTLWQKHSTVGCAAYHIARSQEALNKVAIKEGLRIGLNGWSNMCRNQPSDQNGMCSHFTRQAAAILNSEDYAGSMARYVLFLGDNAGYNFSGGIYDINTAKFLAAMLYSRQLERSGNDAEITAWAQNFIGPASKVLSSITAFFNAEETQIAAVRRIYRDLGYPPTVDYAHYNFWRQQGITRGWTTMRAYLLAAHTGAQLWWQLPPSAQECA